MSKKTKTKPKTSSKTGFSPAKKTTAKEIEDGLLTVIYDAIPYASAGPIEEVKTFEEAGIITYNSGLVVEAADGSRFEIVITKLG